MVDFSGKLRIPRAARPVPKITNAKAFSPMVMAMKTRLGNTVSKVAGSTVLKLAGKSITPVLHVGIVAAFMLEIFSKDKDGKSPQDERTRKQIEEEKYNKEFQEGYEDGYKAYAEEKKSKYGIAGTRSKRQAVSYLGKSGTPFGKGK